jgi:DNA polymerase-3 subunit delta'
MLPVIGHAPIVRELRDLACAKRLAHAVLFAGPEGTGRTRLAVEYALLLNCEGSAPAGATLFGDLPEADAGRPCGECRPCRLIAAGGHPDVVMLGPGDTLCQPRPGDSHASHADSRDIRICQVRGLVDLSARFPLEARTRVIVIEPAERLGRDAAHAILKTLEEPPGHTVFCLVTAAPEEIIETIRSRCRRIEVQLVPREVIREGLVERGVAADVADRASGEARGRPARALAFAERPDLMDDRARFLERCAGLAAEGLSARLKYAEDLAERWRRDRRAVTNEIDAWEAFWEGRLRDAARDVDERSTHEALGALRAVTRAREDLLAQVQVRPALELMLLQFPRLTLGSPTEEPASAHA